MADKQASEGPGREASRPGQIPRRGWKDIAKRVKAEIQEDDIGVIAAGVAFYAFLALVPALASIVSIYGLVSDPADLQRQLSQVSHLLPAEARTIIENQFRAIVTSSNAALGLGFIVSLLLTIWSAASGTKTLIAALNVCYDEEEKRGFFKLNAVALLLTLGAILAAIVALAFVVALPVLLNNLGLPGWAIALVSILRWAALAVAAMFGLAVLYRFAPSRDKPRWQWVSWGAVLATILWLVVSGLFSFYVSNFGNYNETYGSLGAIVILLTWFLLTAYSVLLGAEVNAEIEHQTARDTTEGEPRPRGQRGAHVADTLGGRPERR